LKKDYHIDLNIFIYLGFKLYYEQNKMDILSNETFRVVSERINYYLLNTLKNELNNQVGSYTTILEEPKGMKYTLDSNILKPYLNDGYVRYADFVIDESVDKNGIGY